MNVLSSAPNPSWFVVHKPHCESLSGPFIAAAMKIMTRRATETINRIAHAMTPQLSNLDAEEWPC
jgi:hypothetical protein